MPAYPPSPLNPHWHADRVSQAWDSDIVRQLTDYIAIPAQVAHVRGRLG